MPRQSVKKVVLAYSGGLDSSIIVPWLIENYGCEVICFVADVGQGEELDGVKEKALNSGASQVILRHLLDEYTEDYLLRALRAGAIYERKYLLGTPLTRPLIAKHQVEVAHEVGADGLAHGATSKGNGQVRFELAYAALDPHLKVIAPWREWDIQSRQDAISYARQRNIPVVATEKTVYNRDRNLWHLYHEGRPLEETWVEPDESMFLLSASPEEAPDEPQYIEITYESGTPLAVNGEKLSPAKLIACLNVLGGANGVGRVDMVESQLVGVKSRGVYEAPGAMILMAAHRELEALVLDRETIQFKDMVALKYAELVYNGMWFTPLREALDAFIDNIQGPLTGTVRLKLYKGNIILAGSHSPFSLYRASSAAREGEEIYDRSDAQGFIHLYSLPARVRALNGFPTPGLTKSRPDYSHFKINHQKNK